MSILVSRFAVVSPLLAAAWVVLLAAAAIDETLTRMFAGLVGGIALLMQGIALARRAEPAMVRCWAACAVVLLSVAAVDWPLRLSYLAARPGLERLAQRLRAGESIAMPVRVGLIVVRGTELRRRGWNDPGSRYDPTATDTRDIACLWTNTNPAGFGGFVQCRPQYLQFNIWSHLRLDERRQFITED